MNRNVDVLVVGAGFAGAVLAERLAEQYGQRVLVIEKRAHLGGNAHDSIDAHGVMLHSYGPHYFRTNSARVLTYLSRFTDWHPVEYRALSGTHGGFWPFPINLDTLEQFFGTAATSAERPPSPPL